MINGRRYKSTYLNAAAFMCIVFLACTVAAPVAWVQPGRTFRTHYNGNQAAAKGSLAVSNGRAYLISESSENEILSIIQNSFLSNRIVQNYNRILLRVIDSLFPFAGFSLLLCRFGHFIRKRSQNISIMAMSIGGHAPPYCIGIKDIINL